jgi:ABC-2 type transport system ATP-binding protein
MELRIVGLSKKYGARSVLNGVSFAIPSGEVVGFIGPNGAGKSTTMKILLGLVKADAGQVSVGNNSLSHSRQAYLSKVAGFVDGPPQYPVLNARDHLIYAARLRGTDSTVNIDEVLDLIGFSSESRKPVSQFSMGMKQRLAIGMALLQNPEFLILDEPANGLDPTAIIEFRQLIRSLAEEKRVGVFISSHILSEVERICDQVVFIRGGEIARCLDLRMSEARTLMFVRTTDDSAAGDLLAAFPGIERVESQNEGLFVSVEDEKLVDIPKLLVRGGIGLKEFSPAKNLLEADYLREFQQKEALS